jgi:hypothetical protein
MLPLPARELPPPRPTKAAARECQQQLAQRLLREASLELARLRRIRGACKRTARRIAGARRRLALAAGLLGVPLAPAAGALTPTFVSPFLIPAVEGLASPAFADLDGDGDLDAFVGEKYGNTIFFENVELGPGTCADGLDNDLDGRIDSPSDPGCADAADPNERSTRQCDNGLDDDHDGKIDWRGDASGDPHCTSLTDNNESTPPPWGCGLGPELLLLGPILTAMRRHSRSPEPNADTEV